MRGDGLPPVRRIDEAASHAREALALTRRLGARGAEAHTLCLAGDVAAIAEGEDAEGYYRQALALADPRGMRPLVAHCHLGLGKLHRRRGDREQAQEHLTIATAMYREMAMTYTSNAAYGFPSLRSPVWSRPRLKCANLGSVGGHASALKYPAKVPVIWPLGVLCVLPIYTQLSDQKLPA